MIDFQALALPVTIAVLAVGLVIVVVWALRSPASGHAAVDSPPAARGGKKARGNTIHMPCNRCGHALEILTGKLERLSGVERALTVRSHPALAQREMAEFTCPNCEATHCFAREGSGWAWAGSNLYVPQASMAHCAECGKGITHLEPVPEENAAFFDARALGEQAGVRCARCDALVCVSCLLRRTHAYQPGASVICPRCGRAAVGPAQPLR
jgi:predicted RNA-binding Zn-ribbon protein involved in translation (DUF1610 family)